MISLFLIAEVQLGKKQNCHLKGLVSSWSSKTAAISSGTLTAGPAVRETGQNTWQVVLFRAVSESSNFFFFSLDDIFIPENGKHHILAGTA